MQGGLPEELSGVGRLVCKESCSSVLAGCLSHSAPRGTSECDRCTDKARPSSRRDASKEARLLSLVSHDPAWTRVPVTLWLFVALQVTWVCQSKPSEQEVPGLTNCGLKINLHVNPWQVHSCLHSSSATWLRLAPWSISWLIQTEWSHLFVVLKQHVVPLSVYYHHRWLPSCRQDGKGMMECPPPPCPRSACLDMAYTGVPARPFSFCAARLWPLASTQPVPCLGWGTCCCCTCQGWLPSQGQHAHSPNHNCCLSPPF